MTQFSTLQFAFVRGKKEKNRHPRFYNFSVDGRIAFTKETKTCLFGSHVVQTTYKIIFKLLLKPIVLRGNQFHISLIKMLPK